MRKTLLLLGVAAAGCAGDSFQSGGGESESEGEPGGGGTPAGGGGPCVLGGRCEFDAECCAEHECRAGSCQPRETVPACGSDADCPGGAVCEAGACVPPSGACTDCPACSADADCPAGDTCIGGICVPPGMGEPDICEDDDPSLAGTWLFDSTLYMGDGVASWAATALEVIDEIEDYLCDYDLCGILLDCPEWACAILGGISDINDMLDVMYVNQEIALSTTGVGTYYGTEEWVNVGFYLDGVYYEGAPEDVYSWEIDVEDLTAGSCAGTFTIDEHHVSMNFCEVVRWAIDIAVWAASDGAYGSLEGLVTDACYGIPGCWELVEGLLDDLIGCAGVPLLGFDYSGTATIVSEEFLDDGVWAGEMDLGGSFPGEFTALKE